MNSKSSAIIMAVVAVLVVAAIGLFLSAGLNDGGTSGVSNSSSTGELSISSDDIYAGYEIVSTENVSESATTQTGQQAIDDARSRGFDGVQVYAIPDASGAFEDDTPAEDVSDDTAPYFYFIYTSATDMLWTIGLCNGECYAYPFAYCLDRGEELILVESDAWTTYDTVSDQYVAVSLSSAKVDFKQVPEINASVLDALGEGEIENL